MNIDSLKDKLAVLEEISIDLPEKKPALDELAKTVTGLLDSLKRIELKFETVIEVTSQINSKSLDLDLIENFTLNTLMGYFICPQVFLMRRDNYRTEQVIVSMTKNIKVPNFTFEVAGPFAQKLLSLARPFEIARHEKEFNKFRETEQLRKIGVEYLVPLIKQGEQFERNLQGLICMGKKFKGADLSDEQLDFLELVGTMIAISLHNAQLYHRSIYDGLTQVYSRGHFDVHLTQELERAKRYSNVKNIRDLVKHVSLIMLDIDDFKKFNDTYGHQTGDAILKSLAQAINSNCRTSDTVARYGGEEFCIILPETDKDAAILAAERLIQRIRKNKITYDGRELNVSVSMGVSSFPSDCDGMADLIREADKALYVSKSKGKDMYSVAPGRTKPPRGPS